jgi:hypothetical protein
MMQHQHFYRQPSSSFDESSIDNLQAPTFRCAHAPGDISFSSVDDEVSCEDDNIHNNLQQLLVLTYPSNHQAHCTDSFKSVSDPAKSRKCCGMKEFDSSE